MSINVFVAFLGIGVASSAQYIADGTLAFMISSISIHVACLAALVGPAWLFYSDVTYDGDLE
jgi:hypothetical protein